MPDADDLALLRAARAEIADGAEQLYTALKPVTDAPGVDTDTVSEVIQQLWFVDDALARGETQICRTSGE